MLLKGKGTITSQKWGSTPHLAGSKMGYASEGQFSRRGVCAAFVPQKRTQARHLHSRDTDETFGNQVDAYRSGNEDGLAAKRTTIQ